MMKFFLASVFALVGFSAVAQQNYAVSSVPKDLLPYASSVIRNEEVTYKVLDLDNVVYHLKKAVTVFNKNGDDAAQIDIGYDKRTSVKYVRGFVFNEFGQQTNKFTLKEFKDYAAISNSSLFEDNRIKHYEPVNAGYPYTVEYEYEVSYRESINLRSWLPVESVNQAVEKSSFTLIHKPDLTIRYKQINLAEKPVIITDDKGFKLTTWQINDSKALKDEPYSPNWREYLPRLLLAPNEFLYGNIRGGFSDWNGMGRFVNTKLLAGRDRISPETTSAIKALTENITDERLKARKIYEYMQQKTHYISVQVGVGGYQPFLASDVDKLNYGDCKALVNYTAALLKVADIPSYYCIVKSGDEKVSLLTDFASMSQADHAILCIPLKNDTAWVDCTSQKMPFGYLGSFTADRLVLACTPEGGKLMRTPKYNAATNLQVAKGLFAIDSAGVLRGNLTTTLNGLQYDNDEGLIGETTGEQAKLLQKRYSNISNLYVQGFDIKQDKGDAPATTENLKIEAVNFASTDNGKLYFSINPVNRINRAPRDVRNRATNVCITTGYTDEDELVYILPANYKSDHNLLNVNIDKPFGKFRASMTINGNKLTYKRYMQVIDGTYKKELYRDLVDFYQAAVDADNYNATLIKL
ncbi:DUF3857 domain-containing protein [Mucilaginibacter pallidiroseus]|uniref:DUF3857 domain-containing protein n=1 Tax=Mucilaginibacter pallidiroseus TaxID=2599295 RepID=A0A563UJT5_9SPHI|nr:DUF3857 domain-containing protein [Mucilaginibacter pallidiroseus]TWR31583.1 DUF3857 domain-containing protein [Mucilaginibacter pallidiroseus]